ncbi:MAG: glycosyltransferase family 2 protein [Alphaproteobacteria bacterium]|nr:glycosyltransferase family 2 protein [Alphaproteobacteria bacterium]
MKKDSKPIKKIAAIVMARNDEFFLSRWIKYYGEQLGKENLYVYLDGLDQKPPANADEANVIILEKKLTKLQKFEQWRAGFMSERAAELFAAGYEIVIGTDSDEFLIADPKTGMNLAEYLSSIKIKDTVSGLGLDVGEHLKKEKTLDKTKPLLAQRGYARINSRFTKTNVISKPVRWGWGFHRVRKHNFKIDPNLYLIHAGNMDYEALMTKYNSADIIARGEQAHFKRARIRIVDDISSRRAMKGDKVFWIARLIQTIFRPPYAWNKPSMLEMRWVVKLPERFRKLV